MNARPPAALSADIMCGCCRRHVSTGYTSMALTPFALLTTLSCCMIPQLCGSSALGHGALTPGGVAWCQQRLRLFADGSGA
jgi:hypothetical protein